jgi:hypothetical protein
MKLNRMRSAVGLGSEGRAGIFGNAGVANERAAVVTETATRVKVEPLDVIDDGATLHDPAVGAPTHSNEIG